MNEKLIKLSKLNFDGRGESFVESNFLIPLLECLGYVEKQDYDVIIHGDDGSSFKLNYPPVELGAKAVKQYNPDYIPTIRKKCFWIIEAKSAKEITYPFDYKYIVQGLQYCIHPEIQAEYMVLSNGLHTCVYEPYRATFLDGDFYKVVLDFSNQEIVNRWQEIYNLLSIEKIRERIEGFLVAHYEKLAQSSFDKNYPETLWKRIGKNKNILSTSIEKHCRKIKSEINDKSSAEYNKMMELLPSDAILRTHFDFPLRWGKSESEYFIEKRIHEKKPELIFEELLQQYEHSSIFRKEHIFLALTELYFLSNEPLQNTIKKWLIERQDGILNKLNRNETTLMRIVRKIFIITVYPDIRNEIDKYLLTSPEIEKYVLKPRTLDISFAAELMIHDKLFDTLLKKNDEQLDKDIIELSNIENKLEVSFKEAYKRLSSDEVQIGGFEWYGYQGKHYAFRNILINQGIISRESN